MSLLRKLKRDLLKINTPTRHQEVCKALQTIFHDMEVGLTDKEAFNILGWEYETKEELFNVYDKDKITVTPYDKFESIVFNSHVDKTDGVQISIEDVYVVWFCKTLQNWKALLSTNVPDGVYYEITHNGDKNETYVDVYKKWENFCVK